MTFYIPSLTNKYLFYQIAWRHLEHLIIGTGLILHTLAVIYLVIVKWFSDNVKCQHELVNSRKIGFDFDLIES